MSYLFDFTKYEGAGNDFILFDCRQVQLPLTAALIRHLCDRHYGVGADGVMILTQSQVADARMHYYNADGSEGEMCGNGARSFALFAHHLGIGATEKLLEASDGVHRARIVDCSKHLGTVEVSIKGVDTIVEGENYYSLNTGVPHYVEFVDNVDSVDVVGRGREIRYDLERFERGTNVNFVEIISGDTIKIRTYERGVECETLACGTGAAAAAIALSHKQNSDINTYRVEPRGGALQISFTHQPKSTKYTEILLRGDARRTFSGQIDIQNLKGITE